VVNPRYRTIILFLIDAALIFMSCVPAEETGAGNRSRNPVQILGPIDTTHRVVHNAISQGTPSKPKIDSVKNEPVKKTRVAPKFKSRQDTVRASVVTKSKSSPYPLIKIIRPEHPVYTVQVGTFGQVSNALRAQKKAKERFTSQPVFNVFIKHAKLYRVSIGRYDNREDAYALYDSMKQKYPNEYRSCWVNFIP
jgi:cell division septation protein DedD